MKEELFDIYRHIQRDDPTETFTMPVILQNTPLGRQRITPYLPIPHHVWNTSAYHGIAELHQSGLNIKNAVVVG
jgi:hypothetical protein